MNIPAKDLTLEEWMRHAVKRVDANDGKPTLFSFALDGKAYFVEIIDGTQCHLEFASGSIDKVM